jgi:hypothetical protein
MPYANFDDVQSIKSLYVNYLQEDNDTNVFEFIGEKILSAGLITDGDEVPPPANHHPIQHTEVTQIHSGVLFQPTQQEIQIEKPIICINQTCNYRNNLFARDFDKGIFHPPLA